MKIIYKRLLTEADTPESENTTNQEENTEGQESTTKEENQDNNEKEKENFVKDFNLVLIKHVKLKNYINSTTNLVETLWSIYLGLSPKPRMMSFIETSIKNLETFSQGIVDTWEDRLKNPNKTTALERANLGKLEVLVKLPENTKILDKIKEFNKDKEVIEAYAKGQSDDWVDLFNQKLAGDHTVDSNLKDLDLIKVDDKTGNIDEISPDIIKNNVISILNGLSSFQKHS